MDLLNSVWQDLNNPRIWKRAPTLAQDLYRDYYRYYRQIFHRVRPFNIHDKALRTAVELSLDGPEKTAERLFMSRLPFPEVWIEFDLHEKLRIGADLGISPGVDQTTPERIGFLFQEDPGDPLRWSMVTWVSINNAKQPAHELHRGELLTSMAVNAWMVDTAKRAAPERMGNINGIRRSDIESAIQMNVSEDLIDDGQAWRAFAHLGWGYGSTLKEQGRFQDVDPMRILGEAKPLSHSINVGWEPMAYKMRDISKDDMNHTLVNSCLEARGDVRLAVTLLALINEVPIVETPVQRKGSFSGIGGSLKRYLVNNTVTINIPSRKPTKQIRKIWNSKIKSHKARHEVRGHWRTITHKEDHWRKVKNPDGSFDRVFIAAGQLERVWVKHHERGDAAYGYVKHDYQVDKRK